MVQIACDVLPNVASTTLQDSQCVPKKHKIDHSLGDSIAIAAVWATPWQAGAELALHLGEATKNIQEPKDLFNE